MYHGRVPRFRRWAYQANVMKMFDRISSPAVRRKIDGMRNPPATGSAPPLPSVPAFAGAERSDLCDVVPAVPGIRGELFVQSDGAAVLGVNEAAVEIGSPESTQQEYPTLVQAL